MYLGTICQAESEEDNNIHAFMQKKTHKKQNHKKQKQCQQQQQSPLTKKPHILNNAHLWSINFPK